LLYRHHHHYQYTPHNKLTNNQTLVYHTSTQKMLSPLQSTESRRTADGVVPGFYFPTDVDGNVLPLFSGGRPRGPTSTHSAQEIRPTRVDLPKPGVVSKRAPLVPADAELNVLHPPSAPVRRNRLVRAQSAPTPRITLTPPLQRPEPLHQAPLFPCDASGAVLPLFHPSTSTPGSPRPQTGTTTTSPGNSCTCLPCNAGAVLGLFDQPVTAGDSTSVPVVAIGVCDDDDDDDDEDGVESVIEWIDEMLSARGVVEEGSGRSESRRGGRGKDAREVLEWLEGLRLEE
ncbi:hypothetical protein HOY80DRAFT_1108296, partial [Tuber brumale]